MRPGRPGKGDRKMEDRQAASLRPACVIGRRLPRSPASKVSRGQPCPNLCGLEGPSSGSLRRSCERLKEHNTIYPQYRQRLVSSQKPPELARHIRAWPPKERPLRMA